MKVLLLGRTGQLGLSLAPALAGLGELTALDRGTADLSDLDALRRVVLAQAPDVIVNAAAHTAVDQAEHEPGAAMRINAEAVAVLAELARQQGALLVHYSTDYVFDGAKMGAYVESDAAHPLNVYGRSKLAGEQAVRDSGCHGLVLRTSWAYAAHGSNFVRSVLALAASRDSLQMVADQVGAPTATSRIASVSAQAIEASLGGRLPPGLYHLAATGAVDRHTLACRIVERALRNGQPLRLRPEYIQAIDTPDDPARARRPRNSHLDNSALSHALGIELPDWRVDLDATVDALARPGSA